jgi:hypothetical protein
MNDAREGRLIVAEATVERLNGVIRQIIETATDLCASDDRKVGMICAILSDLTCPENAPPPPTTQQIISTVETFVDGRGMGTYHYAMSDGEQDAYGSWVWSGKAGIDKALAHQEQERAIYASMTGMDTTDYVIVTPKQFHAEEERRRMLAERLFIYEEQR